MPERIDMAPKYLIVEQWSAANLEIHVINLMKLGWRPLGGVAILKKKREQSDYFGHEYKFCQAMIKQRRWWWFR